MLDLTRLRVLSAVATHGSVTAAALSLHYSQPSVSHHLSRLESEVGMKLIRKAGRGIRLTPEGELLARRAVEIIGRVEAAEAELTSLTELRCGRVRVAAFQSALSVLVPPAATALAERHPGLEIQLEDAHPTVALARLRAGTVDLAIVHTREAHPPPGDDVRWTPLMTDPMFLLDLAGDRNLEDHRDSPWIAGCVHCRTEFVQLCAESGFEPRIAYTSDDIVVDQALVAAGLGVTTMPGLALRSYRAPGIEATEIPGAGRHLWIATFGAPPDPPATAAFVEALRRSLDR